LLEQETRKRVLNQIAQDRLERAQKFVPSSDASGDTKTGPTIPQESKNSSPKQNDNSGFARIQFKKPTGETEMHIFNITDTFLCVRNYVQNSVLAGTGIKEFSLATTFPKKEFLVTDNDKTLLELSLTPSAVILILIATRSSRLDVIPNSGGLINMFSSIVMGIVSPILALLGTIKNYVFHSRSASAADAAAGEQKRSNEERISDNDS
jgi:UBX domain-containing protein 1/4